MPTTTETLDVAREVSLLMEAICACSQTYGRHANDCPTARAVNTNARARHFRDALAAHDRRLLAATEEFCRSCGEAVDPDNLCRVNGITYHLGNCPRPHGEPPLPETYDADAARPGWEMLSSDGTRTPLPTQAPDTVWDQALTLTCPRCHAKPGDLCTDVPPGSEPQIHLRRIEALP